MGKDISNGDVLQTIINRNHWFAAELDDINSFCLIGCVVSLGFEFSDFEIKNGEELMKKFPPHKELIKKFTK